MGLPRQPGSRSTGHDQEAVFARTTQVLSFGACGWRMAFTGCGDVADGVKDILRGWNIREFPQGVTPRPHAHITRTKSGRYLWRSERMPRPALWDSDPPTTPMNVIRDVHDVIFDWFLKEHPGHLCLHAAAVHLGDGVVCFPSTHKAGKSTLSVALAASGQVVYSDDVLPIEPNSNHAKALGIAPILRRPLPKNVGAAFRDFVATRKGPHNRGWVYVRLGEDEIAPFGETAPIEALVLLDRKDRGRATLEPLIKSEALKEVILQNFADQVPPVEILDRLLLVTRRAQCCRLQFARPADAAKLLLDSYGDRKARTG
jgi:hypothetical protein